MSSELKSEMSSISGKTGGVLYSCDVVLLLSDCVAVMMTGGELSWSSKLFCCCVVSSCCSRSC